MNARYERINPSEPSGSCQASEAMCLSVAEVKIAPATVPPADSIRYQPDHDPAERFDLSGAARTARYCRSHAAMYLGEEAVTKLFAPQKLTLEPLAEAVA